MVIFAVLAMKSRSLTAEKLNPYCAFFIDTSSSSHNIWSLPLPKKINIQIQGHKNKLWKNI